MKPEKEDLLLLNVVWMFKAGLITGGQCLNYIEKCPHSFENLIKGEKG